MADDFKINDLYKEILYAVHTDPQDMSKDVENQRLSYIKELFDIPGEEQQKLIEELAFNKPSDSFLKINVIEARNIKSSKIKDASNMFLRLYLLCSDRKYETAVHFNTTNPKWKEEFTIKSNHICDEETLCFELWNNPKSVEIVKTDGMKNIAKCTLIGSSTVLLRTIPVSGINLWLNISKKGKMARGELNVNLKYTIQTNADDVIDRYALLLKKILRFDLKKTKIAPYQWAENFSFLGMALNDLFVHINDLSVIETNIAKWIVYCEVHLEHELCFSVFLNILNKLEQTIPTEHFEKEHGNNFRVGAYRILPSLLMMMYTIISEKNETDHYVAILHQIIAILNKLALFNLNVDVGILKPDHMKILEVNITDKIFSINEFVAIFIKRAGSIWFYKVIEKSCRSFGNAYERIAFWFDVVKHCIEDVVYAKEHYDNIYGSNVLKFSSTIYTLYENLIYRLIMPSVKYTFEDWNSADNNIQEWNYYIVTLNDMIGKDFKRTEIIENDIKSLELYMELKKFSEMEFDCNANFHTFFDKEVPKWLNICKRRCLRRIELSVNCDKLEPIHEIQNYSDSPADTVRTLNQFLITWSEIDWPDEKDIFIWEILEIINECCQFYGQELNKKIEKQCFATENTHFYTSIEWCRCINNLFYLNRKLYDRLKIEELLNNTTKCSDNIALQDELLRRRQDTQVLLMNNISDILLELVKKIFSCVINLMNDNKCENEIHVYLKMNIDIIQSDMKDEDYKSIANIIWKHFSDVIINYVDESREKEPEIMKKIHTIIKIIRTFKQNDGIPIEDSSIESADQKLMTIERIATYHSYETSELIREYYKVKWRSQNALNISNIGELSIRIATYNDLLTIEVLNGNFSPMQSWRDKLRPYISIYLYPDNLLLKNICIQTQTQSSLFALYDEIFKIKLKQDYINRDDVFILFQVKSYNTLKRDNFIGEGFISFTEVIETQDDIYTLSQKHLKLSKPTNEDNEIITILKDRKKDANAKTFLKELSIKMK